MSVPEPPETRPRALQTPVSQKSVSEITVRNMHELLRMSVPEPPETRPPAPHTHEIEKFANELIVQGYFAHKKPRHPRTLQ